VGRARVLTAEFDRVEQALGQAEESVKLNPRSTLVTDPRVYLRRRLESMEHATLIIRGIARSLNDSVGLPEQANPVRDAGAATGVADVLRELAAALRSYARLAHSSVHRDMLKEDVDHHLAAAEAEQGEVAEILRGDPVEGWPLRGELLTHLNRLRTELQPAPPRLDGRIGVPQKDTWRHPIRAVVNRWHRRRRT
jgi:hypothetical protein